MGWGSGTEVMNALAKTLKKNVKDPKARSKVYEVMVECLTDLDWDCVEESIGIDEVLDIVLNTYMEEQDSYDSGN